MGFDPPNRLAAILEEVLAGSDGARDRLVRTICVEQRRPASGLMRRERPGRTPQPGALIHGALLRLIGGDALVDIPSRRYLFSAARAMRRISVGHARRRAAKRDDGRARVPLDEALAAVEGRGPDVIALHEALERPAREHPRRARVVGLRFFGGLSVPEAAGTPGISDTTAEADRRFARARPRGELGGAE